MNTRKWDFKRIPEAKYPSNCSKKNICTHFLERWWQYLWTQTMLKDSQFNVTNTSQSQVYLIPHLVDHETPKHWHEILRQASKWKLVSTEASIFPYGKSYCIHADKILTCSCVFSLFGSLIGSNPSGLWGSICCRSQLRAQPPIATRPLFFHEDTCVGTQGGCFLG